MKHSATDCPGPEEINRGATVDKWTVIGLLSAVALALALRAWALYARGVVDYDETYYYLLGSGLVRGEGYRLNGLPHTAFPPLYPLLVGITSLFTSNVRLATSLPSALAGAALPVPVFFLARDIYGKRTGLLAAAAVAVWPVLFFVAASHVAYSLRMYFGSEPLYVTLLVSALLFIWLFTRHGGWKNACLAGVFFGLAALVRSEGPVVFAFLFLWCVVCLAVAGKLFQPKTFLQTALIAVLMLAVFSPFLIYVKTVTGHATLGAKLANNARIRETLWLWVEENDGSPFINSHYALNADATQMEDTYWGVSDWHRENTASDGEFSSGFSLVASPDWRWLKPLVRSFTYGPVPIVPRYAWLVVIAGLLFPPWNRLRIKWWSFAAANAAPMVMLAVSLYALPRHELPLAAILIVPFARGLVLTGAFIERAALFLFAARGRAVAVAALLPAGVIFFLLARAGVNLNRAGNLPGGPDVSSGSQAAEHRVAEWLRDNLPPDKQLMSREPWFALWSGMEWRVVPVASPKRILAYARARGIDYAALTSDEIGPFDQAFVLHPYVKGILESGQIFYVFDFTAHRDASAEVPAQ